MRDASLVGRADRVGERDGDGQELLERHPAGGYQRRQRFAVHQLQRDERHAIGFLHRVNGDDVGVIERRGGPSLPLEALAAVIVARQFLRQDLQRHPPAQFRVVGEVDLAHSALAQQFLNSVVP